MKIKPHIYKRDGRWHCMSQNYRRQEVIGSDSCPAGAWLQWYFLFRDTR